MYPHDIPDEAHPLSSKGVSTSKQESAYEFIDVEPLEMSPTWIRSEALHAAVATVQAEATAGEPACNREEILDLARVYAEFIMGETS